MITVLQCNYRIEVALEICPKFLENRAPVEFFLKSSYKGLLHGFNLTSITSEMRFFKCSVSAGFDFFSLLTIACVKTLCARFFL